MKKKIIAVIGVMVIMMGATLAGCNKAENKDKEEKKEVIGIIGAMDVEVNSLKDSAKISETKKIAEMEFCKGQIGEKDVVIVKYGMGKVNAGICANTLINEFGCT